MGCFGGSSGRWVTEGEVEFYEEVLLCGVCFLLFGSEDFWRDLVGGFGNKIYEFFGGRRVLEGREVLVRIVGFGFGCGFGCIVGVFY